MELSLGRCPLPSCLKAPQQLCAALRMWEMAWGAEGMGREKPWDGGRKDTGQGLGLGQGPGRESVAWGMTGEEGAKGQRKKWKVPEAQGGRLEAAVSV